MRRFSTTKQFDRDVKKAIKRGKDMKKLRTILSLIIDEKALPVSIRDHKLVGPLDGSRECHIEPDWLLIYSLQDEAVLFERTGTHSDLFGK